MVSKKDDREGRRRPARLTKVVVEALQPPGRGSRYIRDVEVPGFYVRVRQGPRGVRRAYVYCFRMRGSRDQLQVTIGEHGEPWSNPITGRAGTLTPDVARDEARRLRGIRNSGGDPRAAYRAAAAPAPTAGRAPTVREFARQYLTDHSNVHKATPSAQADASRLEAYILPAIGHLRLDQVGPEHVAKIQTSLRGRPVLANRCLALVSHIYSKAGAGGRRGNWRVLPPSYPNPCTSVDRFDEPWRERYLTSEELARVGAALAREETAHPGLVDALRVLMFTGARPTEILSLRRDELQLAAGVAMVKKSKTGRRPIALPPEAVQILRRMVAGTEGELVFPDPARPERPLDRWQLWTMWKRVREAARCPDVRPYDVRHTFASVALAGGASLEFIGGLLGHTKPETTQRYAHLARAADPMRKVGEKAAREIARALKG